MIKVFTSYSHRDEELRLELDKHLSLLQRQGIVDLWHDRKIDAGDEFDKAIDARLNDADIILLLISADFMHSDYCWGIEMTRAMERHRAKSARVIPVILHDCDWHSAPFGKLTAVPTDGRAISSWKQTSEAFSNVARHIRAVAERPHDPPRQPSSAYCSRCGAPAGKQSTCTGSYTHHQFVEPALPNPYCSRCGATPGKQTRCTGSYTHHEFKEPALPHVYCARCGAAPGEPTRCTGSFTHHEFIESPKAATTCSRCGAPAGKQSTCTGSFTHHEFL